MNSSRCLPTLTATAAGAEHLMHFTPQVVHPLDTLSWFAWTTDEAATSQVEYGISPALGTNTTETSSYVTSHTVLVTSLSPSTEYYFRVRSRDVAGDLGMSEISSFATRAPEDIHWIYLPTVLKPAGQG